MHLALTVSSDNRPAIVDVPVPQVGHCEVLIEIAASRAAPFRHELIPLDTADATPKRPFAPGLDATGRIASGKLDLSVQTPHVIALKNANETLDASRNMPPFHNVALVS